MPSQEEIYNKVSATLVEALNVEEEDIKPTATLQGDLGAESIDFLDIVFRLAREFGIKIPRGELFPESIFQGDPEFVQNGRVTAKGLAELRSKMPFADLSQFEKNPELKPASRERITAACDQVLRRAQEAGEARTDIDGSDLMQLVSPMCMSGTLVSDQSDRLLAMILDGLRPRPRPQGD